MAYSYSQYWAMFLDEHGYPKKGSHRHPIPDYPSWRNEIINKMEADWSAELRLIKKDGLTQEQMPLCHQLLQIANRQNCPHTGTGTTCFSCPDLARKEMEPIKERLRLLHQEKIVAENLIKEAVEAKYKEDQRKKEAEKAMKEELLALRQYKVEMEIKMKNIIFY